MFDRAVAMLAAVSRSSTGSAMYRPEIPPLDEGEIAALQVLLDQVPAPLEPLDASTLDGYLCGVLVQPRSLAERAWWPRVLDIDARLPPAGFDVLPLSALVRRRHRELADSIAGRRWFDPWVFELDGADAIEAVQPWVTGFAIALESFPALLEGAGPEATEALALIYRHLGTDELEDADDLIEAIEELAPPADLGVAVEELVRATLLLADAAGLPRR